MDLDLPLTWPTTAPAHGQVVLRPFRDSDAHLAVELATDPYARMISSIPADCTAETATEWILQQNGRFTEGSGFSFAIADAGSDRAVGQIGIWLTRLGSGRATAGYLVSPLVRGHGHASAALLALTGFSWTLPELHRIELYIELGNTASIRTAEKAGYQREGLLRSHQDIGGRRRDMLLYATVREER